MNAKLTAKTEADLLRGMDGLTQFRLALATNLNRSFLMHLSVLNRIQISSQPTIPVTVRAD